MFKNLIQYAQNSGNDFLIFFTFLAIYGIIKILFFIPESLFHRSSFKTILTVVGSITLIFVVGFLFFMIMDLALGKINIAGINDTVARNNNFLMELDKKIFHTYLPFWFENSGNPLNNFFSNLSMIFVKAYVGLPIIIAISLGLTLIKSGELFTKIVTIYFVTVAISMVFWFFLPATSPLDAYIDKVPEPLSNVKIERYLATYTPSLPVVEFTGSLRKIREQLGEKLWVTTIPSMHIAWSVIVLYSAMIISRYLLYALVPYFILNMTATVLTLQHYAVDVLLGVMVAIFAIRLVNHLSSLKISVINSLSDSMRTDLDRFIHLIR